MSRPCVQLSSPNQAAPLRGHLAAVLPDIAALPGVVGITLNGGLSRGYADQLSEIDLTLFLDANAYAEWQSGRAPLALGITRIGGTLFDLKIVEMAAEQARPWAGVELWDLSYAEILHDPRGLLAALFAEKLARRPQPCEAEGPLFRCWWHWRLAGDIWIHRGDALQGHFALNEALAPLLEALFLANGEYVPHGKWVVHMSRSLAWTPADWERRLVQAMSTGDLGAAALVSRQQVLAGLWSEVDGRVAAACDPDLPVRAMQKTFYDLLSWLSRRGRVPLVEWQARRGLSLLNQRPFYGVACIEGEDVVLDRVKLAALGPDDLYEWHLEIARAVLRPQASH